MKLYTSIYNEEKVMAVGNKQGFYYIPRMDNKCPSDFHTVEKFLSSKDYSNADLEKFINNNNLPLIEITEKDLLSPIQEPRQNIMCMGLNYKDHIEETGVTFQREIKIPKYPIIFTKSTYSLNDPYGDIPLDISVTCELDWESELAVIIGKEGYKIKKQEAYDYIYGYTILNDITARDIQRRHKQFFLGKSLKGSCPIGPCIVSKDEITDPHDLEIKCHVNGEMKQNSNTKYQIFDIPTQIEAISRSTKLVPGDIIATGTPSGVGFARNPPEFLKDGDLVECSIEKLGSIINRVKLTNN